MPVEIQVAGVPIGPAETLNIAGAGTSVSLTPGPDGVATVTVAATGDVVGPAVAVTNDLATFNGTTGKLIKDSGIQVSTVAPSAASDNTKVPTSSAVNAAIVAAVAGLLDLRGAYDASSNLFPATGGSGAAGAILKGDTWYISVAGTLGGNAVEIGDVIFANTDTPGQTAANWDALNVNIGTVGTMAAQNANNVAITGGVIAAATQLNPYSNFVQLAGAGNWTVPAGVTRIFLQLWGGGGGGGGVANAAASGAGGGAGEQISGYYTVVPGASLAYSVGGGGNGGAAGNNNGIVGSNTTFDTQTASGGLPGNGSAVGNATANTTAQLNAIRHIQAPASGFTPIFCSVGATTGGSTGAGVAGGIPATQIGISAAVGANSAGANATGFAAGGGAATSSAGGAFAGGNGAPGTIVILY